MSTPSPFFDLLISDQHLLDLIILYPEGDVFHGVIFEKASCENFSLSHFLMMASLHLYIVATYYNVSAFRLLVVVNTPLLRTLLSYFQLLALALTKMPSI